jgi:hypothetical protein
MTDHRLTRFDASEQHPRLRRRGSPWIETDRTPVAV